MADAIVQKLGATGPTIFASKSLQNGDELTVDTSSTTTTTMDVSGYLYTTSLYDLVKLNVYRPSTGELFTYDVFVRPFGTPVKPFYKFNWMVLSAAYEFTPLELFAQGEQGAWYDPSDLTTLYQDSAGTTPVTADGDPVGLMLDKSGNLVNASSATPADQSYLVDGAVPLIDHTTGSLTVTLPDLGTDATVVIVDYDGVRYLEGQSIAGATTLPQDYIEQLIYIDRQLTAEEKLKLESKYNQNIWLLANATWTDQGQWRDIAIWEDAA